MLNVKIVSRMLAYKWRRYFSDQNNTTFGDCNFIFDPDATEYDWLVVYEDLPRIKGRKFSANQEKLACNPKNTLLTTTEPSNIKHYDKEYTRQFGHLLTSQAPEELPHDNHIFSQAGLMWFVDDPDKSWDFLQKIPAPKNKIVSTVCSSKQQKHTLHNRRYALTMALAPDLPELDIFGRGIEFVESKSQMMAGYQYHLAIENFIGKHHWTEKLSDSFAVGCLPFYAGCTNLEDYFPDESYIEIDLFDTEKTLGIIQKAIADKEFEKRQSAIAEARRRVLEEYSFFAMVNKIVTENHSTQKAEANGTLLSRHAIRKKYPLTSVSRAIKKEVGQYLTKLTKPKDR